MTPNTIYVGRPSKWGNPIRVGAVNTLPNSFMYVVKNNAEAVQAYREWIFENERTALRQEIKKSLKNLDCWCKLSDPCHADVLLEIANS